MSRCSTEQQCEWQPWCRMHANCRKQVLENRAAKHEQMRADYQADAFIDRDGVKPCRCGQPPGTCSSCSGSRSAGVSGTGHQTFCEHTPMSAPNSQG
jgi:hypothetical protein